jgi:hypothetical protein
VCNLRQKEMEIKKLTVKYSDTSAKLQDLSIILDDSTLLAESNHNANIYDLNVFSVTVMMRDKGSDAATLAKNWGIGIEAAKRTRLVTTQSYIMNMIHPTLTKRYKNNYRQLRHHRLPVTLLNCSQIQCTQKFSQDKGTRQRKGFVLTLVLRELFP